MAKIYPKRITNCFSCGFISQGYDHREPVNKKYFICLNPDAPRDMGFGVYVTTLHMAQANEVMDYRPKVRINHNKTLGNVKIPDRCPLQDTI